MAQSAALPANLDLYLHVRVLIALILGLSVTRLVSGIAALVQHPGRYRIWPVHLCWVAWALLNVVTFWWWEFRLMLRRGDFDGSTGNREWLCVTPATRRNSAYQAISSSSDTQSPNQVRQRAGRGKFVRPAAMLRR